MIHQIRRGDIRKLRKVKVLKTDLTSSSASSGSTAETACICFTPAKALNLNLALVLRVSTLTLDSVKLQKIILDCHFERSSFWTPFTFTRDFINLPSDDVCRMQR